MIWLTRTIYVADIKSWAPNQGWQNNRRKSWVTKTSCFLILVLKNVVKSRSHIDGEIYGSYCISRLQIYESVQSFNGLGCKEMGTENMIKSRFCAVTYLYGETGRNQIVETSIFILFTLDVSDLTSADTLH